LADFWIQEAKRLKKRLGGSFSPFWARFLAPDKFLDFFEKKYYLFDFRTPLPIGNIYKKKYNGVNVAAW
jgi:hypothetical protein